MANTASEHIKPCHVGSSEAHNRRTPEYMAHIKDSSVYVRTDLMHLNEAWVASDMENKTLAQHQEEIAHMVKEKTGRALQLKERQRINKKTGKVTTISGSSPIREGVVLIRENTKLDDLLRYTRQVTDRWGIKPLQIFVHRDEGHWSDPNQPDKGEWKPNLHAHIIWDWMNHETGKSYKLGKADMSAMQTLLAETLGMERGKSKAETGREHMERNDFILSKQRQESQTLDAEIADKKKQSERAASGLTYGLANLVGMGKYTAIEKENQALKANLKQANEKAQVSLQKQQKAHAEALQEERKMRHEMIAKYTNLMQKYRVEIDVYEADIKKYKSKVYWRDLALMLICETMAKSWHLFSDAIKALIHYAEDTYRIHFSVAEAQCIDSLLKALGKTREERIAIGNTIVFFAMRYGKLSNAQYHRMQEQVDDLITGEIDRYFGRHGGVGR